jgi:predicted O-linked N-acetylglucosamine transferase (SPINDLY family)
MSSSPYQALYRALDRNDYGGLVQLTRAQLQRAPSDHYLHYLLGYGLRKLGQIDAARTSLKQAVELKPMDLAAAKELALLEVESGRYEDALAQARRVLKLAPQDPQAWFARGAAEAGLHRFDDAERSFARAGEALAPLREGLAEWALLHGDARVAHAHLLALVELRPQSASAWWKLAASWLRLGDPLRGYDAAERCLKLDPTHARAAHLAVVALELGRASSAQRLAAAARAVALAPSQAELRYQYATALFADFRFERAHEELRTVLAMRPQTLAAHWLGWLYPQSAIFRPGADAADFRQRWAEGLARIEAIDLELPNVRAEAELALRSATNFYHGYLGTAEPEAQRAYARQVQRLMAIAAPIRPRLEAPRRGRIRVGVVSNHLYHHSFSKLFRRTVLGLPRERFELIALPLTAIDDDEQRAWRAGCEAFRPLPNGTLAAAAEFLVAQSCDVLLYLDLGMEQVSLALASLRLAPVQLALWGHPITSGLDTIDAFVSSAGMEPNGAEAHYVEPLYRLPGIGACFPCRDAVVVERPPGPLRLVSAQSFFKLVPEHDALYARILAALPEAELHLLANLPNHPRELLTERLSKVLIAAGVDPARVHYYGRLEQDEFLRLAGSADLIIDSLGWSGGVTTLELIPSGRPIVTCPGAVMRARHSYAMLAELELPELICTDPARYAEHIIELARDRARLDQLGAVLAERGRALYEDPRQSPALAAILEELIARA